jgi:gamma-glutamyltranspeptidase / glutathione hydrolase
MRDLQLPGRSTAHSTNGMAATSHPLSTLAALDVLRQGGNAVDAAVTACAVQCVVEPMSTGIGGDCFALLAPGGGPEVIGFNGSGWAPKALTAEHLLQQGISSIDVQSPHSVSVPGAVDAWDTLLRDHGSIDLDQALQPAIGYAEDGWAVTPRVATDWERNVAKLSVDASSAAKYLANGQAPKAGETWRLPELAETLRTIAREGRSGFYEGWVAEDIVQHLSGLGGCHALDDLAEMRGEYVTPISTDYRGHTMFQIPPNGQGITALMMLNILADYDLASLDPNGVARLHLETEASRLAYAARDRYVADQRQADVPVAHMLSAEFADEMRAQINPDSAVTAPEATGPAYRDTIYLTVVDKDRNAVSFINSLYMPFGSGLTAPRSGVVLQNRGAGFRVEPGHPNNVAPRKRPLHTIIPGMCMKDGKVAYAYGVMGGGYQPVGHTHVLTNMIDFGMDPQEALDSPRVFHISGRLDVERGLSEDIMAGLAALGHEVGRPDMPWGGGQIIAVDWENGTLIGGSDPRKDGCALGY